MASPIPTSDHARRAAPWIRRGGGAVLMSAAVHAAAAVTIGGVLAFAPAPSGPAPEPAAVDVAVIAMPEAPLPQSAPTLPAPAVAQPAHAMTATHHRATARPPATTPPAPPAIAPAAPPADEPPMMFALSAGTVASGPALAEHPPAQAAASTASSGRHGDSDSAAVGEHQVDIPARLVAASPLAYPPAARRAEIELDYPLEIVVDATGHVVSARATSHAGYGLDEAALQGIRGYRFSPAMRAGRAVAVRMRWTVQFRLR